MRNILVAALGATPAILTEAFYYYARVRKPPVVFGEVQVLTTTMGHELVLSKLLGHGPGRNNFSLLLKHLKIPREKVTFDENHIYVFVDENGRPLEDVRTHQDSVCVANQTCEHMRQICSRRDTAVYAMIAGGRKTMGVYLSMALQLYGRPQDRLFHVLVDHRIEANPQLDFFFPVRAVKVGHQQIPPSDIRLDCDELPVLYWPWGPEQRDKPSTFSELYQRRQRELNWLYDPPALKIDGNAKKAFIGEIEIDLNPVEFLYYYFFVELRLQSKLGTLSLLEFSDFWDKNKRNYPQLPEDSRASPMFAVCERLEQLFVAICPPTRGRETPFSERLSRDFEKHGLYTLGLSSTLSKIKKKIEQVIGTALAEHYAILHAPEYGTAIYGIRLDPSKIRIEHPIMPISSQPLAQTPTSGRAVDRSSTK